MASHQFSAGISPEFAAWFDRLAEQAGRSKATLIVQGLARIAEDLGAPPPPRRAAKPGRPRKAVAGDAA